MSFHKKNIVLQHTLVDTYTYTSDGSHVNKKYKPRERQEHGTYLLKQLDSMWKNAEQRKAMFATIKEREGTYIEVKGADNCDLLYKSLENVKEGIEFLNLREDTLGEENITVQSAMVFIPDGKENFLNNKIQQYLCGEAKSGKPKNRELVESIETIQLATLSAFWTGNLEDMPDQTCGWCEFWIRADYGHEKDTSHDFFEICKCEQIAYKERIIIFPEKVIVLARG